MVLYDVPMANPEHVAILSSDVRTWNEWRLEYPNVTPDLSGANLMRKKLSGAALDYADLSNADLDGADLVDGQPAYKLNITQKSGDVKHVWVDAKSFLDVKMDGFPRRMDGKLHNVYVYQRDFRKVEGVMIPFVQETAVDGYSDTHKLVIEKAAVNPHLDDGLFGKPHA